MEAFLKSINVWIVKPQVCTPKIFASKILDGSIFSNKIINRKLIFKDNNTPFVEEHIFREDNIVHFISSLGSYDVIFNNGLINLTIVNGFIEHTIVDKLLLENTLSSKLNHWLQQDTEVKPPSLSLIDVEFYKLTYFRLKTQYGFDLVKNWEEKTDPGKFVFEDIAIASYLISLWQHKTKKDIKFVDVGCGNGLLVYILISEGYEGFGVDLRSRHIWDKYPASVRSQLEIGAVTPETHYPGYNWWIGNHSDELTPWIPVLAKRSCPSDTNVFLLPCCPFDFFGKFTNFSSADVIINQSTSRHRNYQQFIESTMAICGLTVRTDTMRIPSTKKFCLVGSMASDNYSSEKLIFENIDNFIESRSKKSDFTPRKVEIDNKNCSTVPHSIRDHICNKVFSELLSLVDIISTSSKKQWNKGGKIAVSSLSSHFSQEVLDRLKSENGGIQTMLKNHHQVFKVVGGFVEIRFERDNVEEKIGNKRKRGNSSLKVKSKLCWFDSNHPDGCPHTEEQCNFIHQTNKN